MKIKRSTLFIVRFDERPQLDLGAMLRGNLAVVRSEPLVATSLSTGETTTLGEHDLRVLQACSSAEWHSTREILDALNGDLPDAATAVEAAVIDGLLARGLLLGDGDDAEIVAARQREERLAALQWDDAALLYHVTSRISGMDAGAALENGPPPDGQSPGGPSPDEHAPREPPVDIGFAGNVPMPQPAPQAGAVTPFAGAASVIGQPPPPWPPAAASSPGAAPHAFGGAPPAPGFVPQAAQAPQPLQQAFQAPQVPPDVAQHVAVASVLGQQLQATVAQYGPPPGPFHVPPNIRSMHDLPRPTHQGPLLDVLLQRRTVRLYEASEALTLDELSSLLYFTYGAHGAAQLAPGVVGVRKTSPSGGAMHPIEVYPLLLQVQNVPPGLYHYSVERHALALLRPMSLEEGRKLAETFTSGQSYYATAHALFILTARFFRTFWKYRKSQKAYKVIHLDAGHLSQTLYLLATALGLGAFFTGAVNDVEIEETLGLDGVEQGVVGISGCGRPRREGDLLGLETQPYTPRAGRI